jgi:hypothetical protein
MAWPGSLAGRGRALKQRLPPHRDMVHGDRMDLLDPYGSLSGRSYTTTPQLIASVPGTAMFMWQSSLSSARIWYV